MKGLRFSILAVMTVAGAVLMTADVPAQSTSSSKYVAPRTAWGDPDLQGIWPSSEMIGVPLQRDPKLGTRAFLTDEEFAQRQKQASQQEASYLARTIPELLAGRRVEPFQYNDLGSLVSLGGETAIGTLMGFARGRRVRVEGFVARLIYRWLYKRHRAVLFGWGPVILDTIGNWLRGATRPRVKLH